MKRKKYAPFSFGSWLPLHFIDFSYIFSNIQKQSLQKGKTGQGILIICSDLWVSILSYFRGSIVSLVTEAVYYVVQKSNFQKKWRVKIQQGLAEKNIFPEHKSTLK